MVVVARVWWPLFKVIPRNLQVGFLSWGHLYHLIVRSVGLWDYASSDHGQSHHARVALAELERL